MQYWWEVFIDSTSCWGRSSENLTSAQIQKEQEDRWSRIVSRWRRLSYNNNCVVVGDLNLDHIKWTSPELIHEKMVDEMKTHIETSGFIQLVQGFTRTWRSQTDSLLDHAWSNCSEKISKIYNDTNGASDHNVVGVEVHMKELKQGGQNSIRRIWKDFKEKDCIQKFKDSNWLDIMGELNVNVANGMLEERIRGILDTFAPMRVVQARTTYQNWITKETKEEMVLRDRARETAKETDTEEAWQEYRNKRNNCTMRQRSDKRKYLQKVYSDIEIENDTSNLFKTTRNLLGWNQPGGPSCLKVDGITYRKQKEIANCQMEFYINKIQNVRNKLPKVNTDPLSTLRKLFSRWIPAGGMPKFVLKCVTEKEVGDMINNLKKSHAFGIDKFDAFTIKMAAGTLIPPITHIINLSLSTGHFPARWKLARILPLLKGKDLDRNNPSSYRPVSQLPSNC